MVVAMRAKFLQKKREEVVLVSVNISVDSTHKNQVRDGSKSGVEICMR